MNVPFAVGLSTICNTADAPFASVPLNVHVTPPLALGEQLQEPEIELDDT
jgi:hypothetical protein